MSEALVAVRDPFMLVDSSDGDKRLWRLFGGFLMKLAYALTEKKERVDMVDNLQEGKVKLRTQCRKLLSQ